MFIGEKHITLAQGPKMCTLVLTRLCFNGSGYRFLLTFEPGTWVAFTHFLQRCLLAKESSVPMYRPPELNTVIYHLCNKASISTRIDHFWLCAPVRGVRVLCSFFNGREKGGIAHAEMECLVFFHGRYQYLFLILEENQLQVVNILDNILRDTWQADPKSPLGFSAQISGLQ